MTADIRNVNNERFDRTYEKRLKARQAEKTSGADSSSEEKGCQSFDVSASVSGKEAKKGRKATSLERGTGPSAGGQEAFLDEDHNGESTAEQP